MAIKIGNAPCSWGVEWADDPRNPTWNTVLEECHQAGYDGIELGPVGFMPEDSDQLSDALAENSLELIGGVVFQPFHDSSVAKTVMSQARRTAHALVTHSAQQMVLIDSISEARAPFAGRPSEAITMAKADWKAFAGRIRDVAKMGTEEYGLTVSIHSHAGGYMDFKDELDALLEEIDERYLKICVDTGHQTYAGFDPVAFIDQNFDRVSYVHVKDIDPAVQSAVVQNRTGFYEACGQGIFCNLGKGAVDFLAAKQLLTDRGYDGWVTVEQDCDPTLDVSPVTDAISNRQFLSAVGF